jgi:hypothetical protein
MKRLAVLLIVAAALLAPSAALASGVVLKVQKAAHLVAVTNGKAKVSLVHSAAASRLKVGERVAMKARTLRNGTLAASSMRVLGRTHKVHFRGLVLKRSGTRLTLSAGGAIISLHRGAGRHTSSAGDTGPTPGTTVDVTATVTSSDELDEDSVSTVSAATPGGAIEGTLTLGTGKITVVSDQMALVINVPSTFDLSKFANGDEVLAKFSQGADGTLTLTDLSGDDNAQQANSDDDGDNSDNNGDNGDNNGGGGGGGGGDEGD